LSQSILLEQLTNAMPRRLPGSPASISISFLLSTLETLFSTLKESSRSRV
jgi:hypothetical protein